MAKKEQQQQQESRAVTKPEGTELFVVTDQVPEHLLPAMGGQRGSESVGQEDLVIPRLEIIQSISPEVTEGDPAYIPGVKPGDMINSVSKQQYGREVYVVPVHYSKLWLVWIDRKQGGGFRGAYPTQVEANDRAEQEGGKVKGVEAVDTPTHLCLLVNPAAGSADEIMISMPRTKAKVSRQWNSMIKMAGGDRFARVYRINTTLEKNNLGQFYNFVVSPVGFPNPRLFQQAEKLYEFLRKGEKRVVMDTTGFNPGQSGGGDDEAEM